MKCINCNIKLNVEKVKNGVIFSCPNGDYAHFKWVDPDKMAKRKRE